MILTKKGTNSNQEYTLPKSNLYNQIAEGFERNAIAKGYKTGNGTMYQKCVCSFLVWLEEKNLISIQHINSENCEAYYMYLIQRPGFRGQPALSQITINHHLFALRLMTDFLWETNRIDYLVVIPPNQRVKKSSGRSISKEEIEILYQLTINSKERAILSLAYGCGLRSKEICELIWSDVLFSTGHLLIRHGKGNKTREVPMSDLVQSDLRNYMNQNLRGKMVRLSRTNFLLLRPSGKPMSNAYLNILLKKIIQRSENTTIRKLKLSLHDLRHSIATHLAENGAEIEFIRDFLGHDSIDTSSLYMIRRKRRNRFIA